MSNNILSVIYKIKVVNVVFKVYDLFHLNLIVFMNPVKILSQYGMYICVIKYIIKRIC